MKKELQDALEALYLDHPDGPAAKAFVEHFSHYCHSIDDIIDEKITEPDIILKTAFLSLTIYSSTFYIKYQPVLYPIINLIHHTYADSVELERGNDKWMHDVADVLKSVQQELQLIIIQILGGYDARRKLSLMVREYVYSLQHDS